LLIAYPSFTHVFPIGIPKDTNCIIKDTLPSSIYRFTSEVNAYGNAQIGRYVEYPYQVEYPYDVGTVRWNSLLVLGGFAAHYDGGMNSSDEKA